MNHAFDRHRLSRDLLALLHKRVIDDQYRGFRVVQRIQDFTEAPTAVHGIEHRIRPGNGQKIFDIARRVLRQHGHSFTRFDTESLQTRGQSCDPLAKLRKGLCVTSVTHSYCVGPLLDMPMQALSDVHAIPLFFVLDGPPKRPLHFTSPTFRFRLPRAS
ncbi:hypothetical protein D3C84_883870 [compost metagenome]